MPTRPSEAVFADGAKARGGKPLALLPSAINVVYPTRKVYDCATGERRDLRACDVAEVVDGVAVLAIDGPLEHKSGDSWWSWWTSYENIAADFKLCLDDPGVRGVILKFDSPGGDVAGLNETVRIMQDMKRAARKPVVGYVDEACYSAAYALACVVDELYLPPSGGVGSIGVITALADVTEADKKAGVRVEVIASGSKKTDGHPHVAMSDDAIKRTRRTVEKLAAQFFDLVAGARKLPAKTIASYEAGVFMGDAAVDAGLADGVMSLAECLTFAKIAFSSSIGTSANVLAPSENDPMSLIARKALADANAALAAAKSDTDRALAAARILAAESELAKVTKTKTTDKTVHTEETDDGEKDAADAADDDDVESTDGGDDVEEDDDEAKGKKASVGETGLHTKDRLLRHARQITGKKSIEEVMGTLDAWAHAMRDHSKLAKKVERLEADATTAKIDALIASGLKSGKLAPSQRGWAKTMTPDGLRAYLDAAPKMVHTSGEEHVEASVAGRPLGSVTAEMAKIWKKQGFKEEDFPKLLEKLNATHTNGAS